MTWPECVEVLERNQKVIIAAFGVSAEVLETRLDRIEKVLLLGEHNKVKEL